MTERTITHFHGDDVTPSSPEKALFHIIPCPYEKSVSYGAGTKKGPQAILDASCQLEIFDNKSCPADYGLYTMPSVDCSGEHEVALKRIKASVRQTLSHNKIPVVLGGEHTVTNGVIDALIEKHGTNFGVIQFDAHADLRETYEGSPFSHACVMKRIIDKGIQIFQIGTRSFSLEEYQTRLENKIQHLDAEELAKKGTIHFKLPTTFPEKVFITFDVDGLDSSIMPATGTPVPGGLNWWDAMWLIESITEQRTCIGFDVLEYAPIENMHCFDFTAAQLVYNIIGYISRSKKSRELFKIDGYA